LRYPQGGRRGLGRPSARLLQFVGYAQGNHHRPRWRCIRYCGNCARHHELQRTTPARLPARILSPPPPFRSAAAVDMDADGTRTWSPRPHRRRRVGTRTTVPSDYWTGTDRRQPQRRVAVSGDGRDGDRSWRAPPRSVVWHEARRRGGPSTPPAPPSTACARPTTSTWTGPRPRRAPRSRIRWSGRERRRRRQYWIEREIGLTTAAVDVAVADLDATCDPEVSPRSTAQPCLR
jgi:hypothetical protein